MLGFYEETLKRDPSDPTKMAARHQRYSGCLRLLEVRACGAARWGAPAQPRAAWPAARRRRQLAPQCV